MNSIRVVLKPLVTEKSTFQSGMFNRYAFQVDRAATKPQIKRAVEDLYKVRVIDVATQNRKGQMRRNRYGKWQTQTIRRAVVKIHPEDRIELF